MLGGMNSELNVASLKVVGIYWKWYVKWTVNSHSTFLATKCVILSFAWSWDGFQWMVFKDRHHEIELLCRYFARSALEHFSSGICMQPDRKIGSVLIEYGFLQHDLWLFRACVNQMWNVIYSSVGNSSLASKIPNSVTPKSKRQRNISPCKSETKTTATYDGELVKTRLQMGCDFCRKQGSIVKVSNSCPMNLTSFSFAKHDGRPEGMLACHEYFSQFFTGRCCLDFL